MSKVRTSRCGLITTGLLTGASLLAVLLEKLFPHVALDDLVFYVALIIAASMWFRLGWSMAPEQPTIGFFSSYSEAVAASGWAFSLAAIVLPPWWVILAFALGGHFTQFSALVNLGLDILIAAVILIITYVGVIATGTFIWCIAVTLRRSLPSQTPQSGTGTAVE
jgi:hypothetical protein